MAMNEEAARERLQAWLDAMFSPIHANWSDEGYYASRTRRDDHDPYRQAQVRYYDPCGIGRNAGRKMLARVAQRLDELGVSYEWEQMDNGFWLLLVVVEDDKLWKTAEPAAETEVN
jgi:hypothetical protein